jgi:hypothetical protein
MPRADESLERKVEVRMETCAKAAGSVVEEGRESL